MVLNARKDKVIVMDDFMVQFFKDLVKKYTTYDKMIDFCCDNMVMNNDIVQELERKGFYFQEYMGSLCTEDDCYEEIFQYFIISSQDAERLSRYTNEFVMYCECLDLYVLGVTHWGTPWCGVPSNWKTVDEYIAGEEGDIE